VHERIKSVLANIRLIKQDGAFAAMASQYDAEARRRASTLTPAPAWTPHAADGRQTTGAATPVPVRHAEPFENAR
jgi:hypothetical protein